jgi:hypothetical protein
MMNHHWKHEKQSRSPFSSIITGLAFACAFGLAWFFTGIWVFIFPMVFAGVLPMLDGVQRLSSGKTRKALGYKKGKQSVERQILLVAKQHKGKVTPALVALNSDIPLEQVEKKLSDMAKKGYAEMHVTRGGRIQYLFHDFSDQDDLLLEE